jgi:hypothetical protein
MHPSLTTQKIASDFETEGAFSAINDYVDRKLISADEASSLVAQLFRLYQAKVEEAQKEVRHLDAVLGRLAHIARGGTHKRPYQSRDPQIVGLAHELTVFDGWVISLYETDLTMISYGAPDRARAKPLEMQRSMDALYRKRREEMQWSLNAPELFRRG